MALPPAVTTKTVSNIAKWPGGGEPKSLLAENHWFTPNSGVGTVVYIEWSPGELWGRYSAPKTQVKKKRYKKKIRKEKKI